MHFNTFQSI